MRESDASRIAGRLQTTAEPIRELLIRCERYAEGGYSELLARIDDRGQLVLDGADAGDSVRELSGDWDYEYTETVPAEWKDTVLLHLIAERFTTTSDFRDWCAEQGIPRKFCSW